ncbi:MAG: phosphate ABC transporter substrate-binding protein PstS [Rhizobiales bacterium]|nr:phosphate ABC transporter substrate-binding protein PstS [Hyphomicrobiales bacterium]
MKRFAAFILTAVVTATSLVPLKAQEVLGGTDVVRGAGSTFAYPMISQWAHNYRRWLALGGNFPFFNSGLDDPRVGPPLDYEPVGSLAGMLRARDRAVDFGASDAPLPSDELAKLGLGQFPIVIGGVVVVVNIDGVGSNEIRFTGEVLADIFLGKIREWSHPAIKALNPDLKLPEAPISVVHRSDGSGTTYNLAHFLAQVSSEWQSTMGVKTLLPWRQGTGAKANEGVAIAVRNTRNSIAYLEYTQATRLKLSTALIRNRAGQFVVPDGKSFQTAAASAEWSKKTDFDLMLTNAPGDEAYPITATVFVLMHKQPSSPRRSREALAFFKWALEKGSRDAATLGYVPLPPALVSQVIDYWSKTFRAGL